MKKITLFITLFLFGLSTHAQEPNKPETIDWIANKLVQHSGGAHWYKIRSEESHRESEFNFNFSNIKYIYGNKVEYTSNKGYIHSTVGNYNNRNDKIYFKVIIDLSNVYAVNAKEQEGIKYLEVKGSNMLTRYFYYDGVHSSQDKIKEEKDSYVIINAHKYKSDDPKNYYTQSFIDFDAEPDLFNRMLKAFQNLAKLNNAGKPIEKF